MKKGWSKGTLVHNHVFKKIHIFCNFFNSVLTRDWAWLNDDWLLIIEDFVNHMKFLSIKCNVTQIQVVLRSVSLEVLQWISQCCSNETSYQLLLGDRENENNDTQLLSRLLQMLNGNMKRSYWSLALEHLRPKNDEVHCKHREAMCRYNTTTAAMMEDLNNITLHLTLVNINASSHQPSLQSEQAVAAKHKSK